MVLRREHYSCLRLTCQSSAIGTAFGKVLENRSILYLYGAIYHYDQTKRTRVSYECVDDHHNVHVVGF
jgi:hypothetical protein